MGPHYTWVLELWGMAWGEPRRQRGWGEGPGVRAPLVFILQCLELGRTQVFTWALTSPGPPGGSGGAAGAPGGGATAPPEGNRLFILQR